MNNKPIDKTKKSNIKCEHCAYWNSDYIQPFCFIKGEHKNYWNRCKYFEWAGDLTYKENDNES